MLVKVKTLTGKEIEIDIDPNDKVKICLIRFYWFIDGIVDRKNQGKSRRKGRYSTTTTKIDFWWKANVSTSASLFIFFNSLSAIPFLVKVLNYLNCHS